MKKYQKYGILAKLIGLLITIELILRFGFGFGNPALYQADPDTGYRFQPNQKVWRFGQNIEYNQYSQRSPSINLTKLPNRQRVLMIGDSVLNGGNRIDQKDTISQLLQTELVKSGKLVEVLNASAGSWGIGNQWGYLKKFGLFNSNLLILQIGSHDLIQGMSNANNLGKSPFYPVRKPLLAILEAITYLQYKLAPPQLSAPLTSSQDLALRWKQNQEFLSAILSLANQQKIPVLVLFTPNRQDLISHQQNPVYKSEFVEFMNRRKIVIVDAQTAWSQLDKKTITLYFIDELHLSKEGNQAIEKLLFASITELIK